MAAASAMSRVSARLRARVAGATGRLHVYAEEGVGIVREVLELTDVVVEGRGLPGIVVFEPAQPVTRPRISAFIWGGKVRPVPTLPFGRWRTSTN